MDILTCYDFLTPDEHQYAIENTINSSNWAFKGHSDDKSTDLTFWYLPLDHDTFFTTKLVEKINQYTRKNFVLERVYANGQTYGLSGSLHRDKENGNNQYYTFLYYVQPNWLPEWGGQTVFYDDNEKMVFQQFPTPNLGIIFNSEILHAGLEPTRFCSILRVTIAFKLKLNNRIIKLNINT